MLGTSTLEDKLISQAISWSYSHRPKVLTDAGAPQNLKEKSCNFIPCFTVDVLLKHNDRIIKIVFPFHCHTAAHLGLLGQALLLM